MLKTKTFFSKDNLMVGTLIINEDKENKIGYLKYNFIYENREVEYDDLEDKKSIDEIYEKANKFALKQAIDIISY